MTADPSPAIDALSLKSRDEIATSIATLEAAIAALHAGALADELHARAVRAAQKLAGSSGRRGLASCSDLARKIEQAFEDVAGSDLAEAPPLAELVRGLRAGFDARSAGHVSDDDDGATPASGPHSAGQQHVARTILIIDDSPLMRRLVQLGLDSDGGWSIHQAESGAEGVAIAACAQPDAILLDVEMPDLDGPATLAILRTQDATREIPVLFLTGHSAEADRSRLMALGAAGLIAKPFSPAGLAAEVARLLGWAP